MSSLLALIGVPSATVQLFTTVFLSVLIGAMPFLIVAALASAAIEVYVQPGVLARWLPRRLSRALFIAPLAGMAIPMCECGIVPVAGRLIRKGVPVPVAITFMLANPVLNPLVIYSTWLAFRTSGRSSGFAWGSLMYWRSWSDSWSPRCSGDAR